MGQPAERSAESMNPLAIAVEQGVFYVTLYACCAANGTTTAQQLAIWLGGLKETDEVILTVSELTTNCPVQSFLTIMTAIANTPATVRIQGDTIVVSTLSYFYLLTDQIDLFPTGGLFFPSYNELRTEDISGPSRAVHDFAKWLVEKAVERGIFTEDEALRLDQGESVPLSYATLCGRADDADDVIIVH